MSVRFLAGLALGLAMIFSGAPASAVSITVVYSNEVEVGYNALFILESDANTEATFSSCDHGGCAWGWDFNVTFREEPNAGDGPFTYEGTVIHEDGYLHSFAGVYHLGGTPPALNQSGTFSHGFDQDHYGLDMGFNEIFDFGPTGVISLGEHYNFVINATHTVGGGDGSNAGAVPEPSAALLVAGALVGIWRRGRR